MLQRALPTVERRHFLSAVASIATGLLAGETGRAQTEISAFLAVAYGHTGRHIASDFIGLSYESAILVGGDYFTPDNGSILGLIRSLGRNGVIRIGGDTSARTVWRAAAKAIASDRFVIAPTSIDRLAAAMRILGWKLIYGLNLAGGTPEEAAEEAAYVSRAIGSHLLAFQIGNEPDAFGTTLRPKTYDAALFVAEWWTFHKAIRARVLNAPFAGPDVATATDWVAAFAERDPKGLMLLTHHYYADGPAGAPHVTLAKLLHSQDRLVPALQKLVRYSRAYGLPYRFVETNSVYGEGQPGVSDTLGAALWGLEFMFEAAAAGAAGVNFHTGAHNFHPDYDKAYTPIARTASGRHRAAPLYYGILAFGQVARGVLVAAHIASGSSDLKAFAVRAPDGSLRVCLINKDFKHGVRVTIDPGHSFAASSVMRLSGPAADAKAGITLGGASVDEFGAWAPATSEVAHSSGREISVDVPAASAAVVSMHV
jgi:Glycosyl hydrolase family 79 C-terminal beta domain